MNLLDHNNVREYRPRCGNVIPGTNHFETVAPAWSPPKVEIFSHDHAERVEAGVIRLFADPDIHVVAVSPATITATPEISQYSGKETGIWNPYFAVTVIYQDRLPAVAVDPINEDDGVTYPDSDYVDGDDPLDDSHEEHAGHMDGLDARDEEEAAGALDSVLSRS